MCKIFSSFIWTHSYTLLICTHVTTRAPRPGTSIRREGGREIYVERVPSVTYLYQLCPQLSKPITDHCRTFRIAAAQISRKKCHGVIASYRVVLRRVANRVWGYLSVFNEHV